MKFKLSQTAWLCMDGEKKDFESWGFKFEKCDGGWRCINNNGELEIEFNTIEELINFSKAWGSIIVSGDEIEIYNDYRE